MCASEQSTLVCERVDYVPELGERVERLRVCLLRVCACSMTLVQGRVLRVSPSVLDNLTQNLACIISPVFLAPAGTPHCDISRRATVLATTETNSASPSSMASRGLSSSTCLKGSVTSASHYCFLCRVCCVRLL